MDWHSKAGGRKFLVTGAGLALCALGALLESDGNYYLALGGIVGAFVTGNTMIEKAHANVVQARAETATAEAAQATAEAKGPLVIQDRRTSRPAHNPDA